MAQTCIPSACYQARHRRVIVFLPELLQEEKDIERIISIQLHTEDFSYEFEKYLVIRRDVDIFITA
jgi:hypothetical protein